MAIKCTKHIDKKKIRLQNTIITNETSYIKLKMKSKKEKRKVSETWRKEGELWQSILQKKKTSHWNFMMDTPGRRC